MKKEASIENSSLIRRTLEDQYAGRFYMQDIPIFYDTIYPEDTSNFTGLMNQFHTLCSNCGYGAVLKRRSPRKSLAGCFTLLFFDDKEISAQIKRRLQTMKQECSFIFAAIVFPDKIVLPEHDVSGVPDIINSLSECLGFPVNVLVEKDFKDENFFAEYLALLENYASSWQFVRITEGILKCIKQQLVRFHELWKTQTLDPFERYSFSLDIESLYAAASQLDNLQNEHQNYLKEMNREFRLRERTGREKICIERFHVNQVTEFAVDLLLRYGSLQEKIDVFLQDIKNINLLNQDACFQNMLTQCKLILDSKSKIALIGTFSSGKTSFINWLLKMEGSHQFRTSGGHNTSILTYISAALPGEPERLLITPKKKFSWDLFSIEEYNEFADVYDSKGKATVSGIDEINRVLTIRDSQGREQTLLLKNKHSDIIVKAGQLLKKGQYLTKGYVSEQEINTELANFKLRPLKEYQYIQSMIRSGKLSSLKLTVFYFSSSGSDTVTDPKQILRFLQNLENLQNILRTKAGPMRAIPESFWEKNPLKKKDMISRISIAANCKLPETREELHDSIWVKYCGSGKDGEEVYMEQPEGYLFTSSVEYQLSNKPFLNYADIVDTPGLGSVSEEHDSITENYLREHDGLLLVMIKISKNAESLFLRRFISEISVIYDNLKKDKNNVFFVCNVWSKLVKGNREGEQTLKKYCHDVYDHICEAGFCPGHFFAIDMQCMQQGNHCEKLYGYQSDTLFETCFLDYLEKGGIRSCLDRLQEVYLNSMAMIKKEYEEQLYKLKRDSLEREAIVINNLQRIKKISCLTMSGFHDLYSPKYYYSLDLLNNIKNSIQYDLQSKKEWDNNISELRNTIHSAEMLSANEEDSITEEYLLCLKKTDPELEPDKSAIPPKGLRHFAFHTLLNELDKEYNSFPGGIHFIKNRKHAEEASYNLSSFVSRQLQLAEEENDSHYRKLSNLLADVKTAALEKLYKENKMLANDGQLKENIKELNAKIQATEKLIDKWINTIGKNVKQKTVSNMRKEG